MDKLTIEQQDVYAPDGVIIIDHSGKIIAFNEAARRITGYKEADVSLKDYPILFKNSESDQSYIDKALNKGKSYSNLTLTIRGRTNKSRW